jgi:hypothetical protein
MRHSTRTQKHAGSGLLCLLFVVCCLVSCLADQPTRDEKIGHSTSALAGSPVAIPCAA